MLVVSSNPIKASTSLLESWDVVMKSGVSLKLTEVFLKEEVGS